MISYLFDIDGTLTEPRKSISPEFEEFFFNWMQDKKVYLVTGSDMPKVREQLSERIIDACSGIFCSMANEFYIANKLIYKNELSLPVDVILYLKEQLEGSKYPNKRSKNFEFRTGMLNFSIAGRDSSDDERWEYEKWDRTTMERERIAFYINDRYSGEVEARIGGQISIDIQNVGNNKSLASKWIRKNIGGRIKFYGDKTYAGGNDYDIVVDILQNDDGETYKVLNPQRLKEMLQ